jgi:hypothetical protein
MNQPRKITPLELVNLSGAKGIGPKVEDRMAGHIKFIDLKNYRPQIESDFNKTENESDSGS